MLWCCDEVDFKMDVLLGSSVLGCCFWEGGMLPQLYRAWLRILPRWKGTFSGVYYETDLCTLDWQTWPQTTMAVKIGAVLLEFPVSLIFAIVVPLMTATEKTVHKFIHYSVVPHFGKTWSTKRERVKRILLLFTDHLALVDCWTKRVRFHSRFHSVGKFQRSMEWKTLGISWNE